MIEDVGGHLTTNGKGKKMTKQNVYSFISFS